MSSHRRVTVLISIRMTARTMKKPMKIKDWRIGTDDVGRPVLLWNPNSRDPAEDEQDPLAQTFDFLQRLDVPELALAADNDDSNRDPYDNG